MNKEDYNISCLAMSIVNFINETNGVDVCVRQSTNDICFDYVIERVKEFIDVSK